MRSIAVSFTLKDQDENEILEHLASLATYVGTGTILIHGFLPRRIVLEKEYSTAVVDALDKHFPIQLNLWKDAPLRDDMAQAVFDLSADVFVIGEVKEGVAEEVALYHQYRAKVYSVGRNGIVRMKNPQPEY